MELYQRRESLSVVDNCLMFGERVVIPSILRQRVLRQFHSGHPGIGRMKSIARSFAYWPGMDAEVEQYVRRCRHCQNAAKMPPRVQPVPWPRTDKPWQRIHLDFAGPINGKMYLIIVDAHSKWPEIVEMTPATSSSTISALTKLFSQLGLPEILVSDNGSQFTSASFSEFCQRNNITHLRSPPYHPQSNGQAERFVDTFKRALLKSRGEGTSVENLQRFLFVYRTTPNESLPDKQTPAEALMGRKLRTPNHAMLPKPVNPTESVRRPDDQSNFAPGSPVYVRDYQNKRSSWTDGIIVKRKGSVMFEVQTGSHKLLRHRNQLRSRSIETDEFNAVQLPLDIIFETFKLPPPTPASTVVPESTSTLQPRRWTSRKCRPVKPLQIDPSKPRY